MFRFKKSAITDVLWLMALLLIFCVVFILEMQFSSTQTIDSYAKDIVNREVTRFASNSNGFSSDISKNNMYSLSGTGTPVKRLFGLSSNLPKGQDVSSLINSVQSANSLTDTNATAMGIMKLNLNQMKDRIQLSFGDNSIDSWNYPDVTENSSLHDRTRSQSSVNSNLKSSDISVSFKETTYTTLVTVTVKYDVLYTDYTSKSGGIFNKKSNQTIHRKVVITRNIENVSRYQTS